MFFIASKVLSFICQPIVWVFVLALMALFHRQAKKRRRYLIASIFILYVFSNQVIFHEFSTAWGMDEVPKSQLKEKYAVAIVLGGLVSINPKREQIEFQSNADRILQVLPLYEEGRVDKILLSGGSGRLIAKEKEADYIARYLIEIGVDSNDVWIENQSRNTYENALYSRELLLEKKISGPILLCTSASHMKRSYLCFKKLGLNPDPYPVDPLSLARDINPETLLIPKASVMQGWYHLIHEWIGLLSYKLMGYC